ncbi:MAG: hypothetical protein KH375_01425 [Alistipes sp.]|nr:hypothetical protein [Alistipes sp.]
MKDILKKYWWAVATIILAPVVINFMLQIPAFVLIVGDNTDWLTFWGNYLGGSVSALIALFVLFKTLQQNHEENEHNRAANEEANEKNRKLQIRVLEYQQQMQWLNLFRQASTQYVQIYNTNDLIAISNMFIFNPQEAHNMLKPLFDRAVIYDMQFAYLRKNNNETNELMKKIAPKFEQYNDVLQDIQQIVNFRKNYPTAMFGHLVVEMSKMPLSQTMKDKITKVSAQQSHNAIQPFADVIIARIHDIKDDMMYIQNLLYDYIHSEQARIDKILEE